MFDPKTGDYETIDYIIGLILGVPLAILMIASEANGLIEKLRAPYVRNAKDD
jgi:hypothetical protein